MNYRFKQAIREELARLESLHLRKDSCTIAAVSPRDYAGAVKARILKEQHVRHQWPFVWAVRFLSLR